MTISPFCLLEERLEELPGERLAACGPPSSARAVAVLPTPASKLLAVKSGGATPLFDALIFAADFISQHRRAGARPVMILFSDGDDTISMHSPREALQAVLDDGALIYSVDMGTARTESKTSGTMFLRRVSEATGGRYFAVSLRPSQQNGAATVLNAVLEDLRASYVVTYDLPSYQAGFHSLRLLPTHNLNLTFHSRNGYEYEPSGHDWRPLIGDR